MALGAVNNFAAIGALLKPTFGQIVKVIPEVFQMQKMFKPESGQLSPGQYFLEPVEVQHGWSTTALGTVSQDVVALNAALADVSKQAQVHPYKYVERRQLSIQVEDMSQTETQAFAKNSVQTTKRMVGQLRRVVEAELLHGQRGYATVASYAIPTVTVTDASFSAALLAELEGARVDVLISAANPTVIHADATALYIRDVDTPAKTIKLSTVRDSQTNPSANVTANIAAGNIIALTGYGAGGSWFGMPGLFNQLLLTSGTTGGAWNIDKAAYRFWRAGYINTTVGNFGLTTLTDAIEGCAQIGGGEDLVALVPFKAWSKLNADGLGEQTFFNNDTSMKRVSGTNEIDLVYRGTKCSVVGVRYMKDGEACVVQKDAVRRLCVGPEINLNYRDGSPYMLNENQETLEQRCRTLQVIFLEKPAACAVLSGITYS